MLTRSVQPKCKKCIKVTQAQKKIYNVGNARVTFIHVEHV